MDREITSRLKPWQVEPAKRLYAILQSQPSAVDMSDTGTGKTYVAAAVMSALRLPTLIIAPKISLSAWQRAADWFGDSFSIINYEKLRTGRTGFGNWDNQHIVEAGRNFYLVCEFCQRRVEPESPPCYCHPLGVHCVETKQTRLSYGKFNFHPGVKAVVFDEIHRCGGERSLNGEILIAARRQSTKILGLSATMAMDPVKMRALGYALDLHNDKYDKPAQPNFYRWAARHGCRRIPPMPGIRWAVGHDQQRQIMAGIRSQIIPDRGVRVTTDEIPDFPECDITAELYDLDKHDGIDCLYEEMSDAIRLLKTRSSDDKDTEHPLTKVLRARQEIELLKVPVATELAQDYIEHGLSIAIFVNFQQTLDELRHRLKCDCFIDGTRDGVKIRHRAISDFQSDRERIILANNDAGGICVDLHDLHGNFPRGGLVFPNFSAASMIQVFGRLRRTGGKSRSFYRVLLAAGTVEVSVYHKFRAKMNNLSALLDGDLTPDNLPLTKFVQ